MSESKTKQKAVRFILALIVVGIFTFPTYWMVTMAFKPKAEWSSAAGVIYWVPKNPTLDNFDTVLTEYRGQFFRANQSSAMPAIRSSVIVSVGGTLFALIIGTL